MGSICFYFSYEFGSAFFHIELRIGPVWNIENTFVVYWDSYLETEFYEWNGTALPRTF